MNEQELYDRLVDLYTQQLVLAQDISQLKKDARFNKKTNPGGIDKKEIPVISDAAKLDAKSVFEEFAGKNFAVITKFKQLSGYDN